MSTEPTADPLWEVSRTFVDPSFPASERYDYSYFTISPDEHGVEVQTVSGGLRQQFGAGPQSSCCTQFAYPVGIGLVASQPSSGSTNYESGPDPFGAAIYNLNCTNTDSFGGTTSGGPLVSNNAILGVLQAPKSSPFFTGVVGPFLEGPAQALFNQANLAA